MQQAASEGVNLRAQSPFELRVNLGVNVAECDVRTALATGEMGFLHSFTTGSTVDGPGVRVVAWTTGCQFRCLYCHNPDTWTMTNGIPVSVSRAVEELRKYRQGLKVMSGGLTLSGGEPLMQDRFAVKFLSAARALGVHTALDTNGSLGDRLSDSELQAVDLVLLDIKSWDSDTHRKVTGMEVRPVLDFARRLSGLKKPMWVRFVLVPGLTDEPGNVTQIARFAASLGNVQRVDVLPFHQMGRFKWKQLNLQYTLETIQTPSPQKVAAVCDVFRQEGLTAY